MGNATRSIPFLTTTLDIRWLSGAESARYGVYAYFGAESLPYFRVTPHVAAWLNRKMAIAIDRADGGERDLADALIESGSIDRYWEVANWADREYGVEVVAASMPELPRVEALPPDDALPADPVVWSGAFDGAQYRQSSSSAPPVIAIPSDVVRSRRKTKGQKASTRLFDV